MAHACVRVLRRYENTEKRKAKVAEKGLLYLGMGVSGGEEGARRGACVPWRSARRRAATHSRALTPHKAMQLLLAWPDGAATLHACELPGVPYCHVEQDSGV